MKLFLIGLLGLVLLGAGCGSTPSGDSGSRAPRDTSPLPSVFDDTSPTQEVSLTRESLAGGVEHVTYAFSTSSQARLELYGFPQQSYAFRLAADADGNMMSAWRQGAPQDVVAGINAMYFLEDLSPAGFFVADGVEQRSRSFDWDLSALLEINEDGEAGIRATTEEPEDVDAITHAAQSYPLLVLNGSPLLTSDSGKVSRRSLVGVDTEGYAWIGVVTDGEVSLYELGQRLAEVEIPWEHVLNLDGGASSGMFVRGVGEANYPNFTNVPSVLFVEER